MPFGIPGYGGNILFDRKWKVTVAISPTDAIEITEQHVAFKIEKSIKDEPNTCDLRIWNLNADHRAAIEEMAPPLTAKSVSAVASAKVKKAAHEQATKGIPVQIEAGYGDDLSLLWLGDLRTAHSLHDGVDWITYLESGDGEKAWKNARVNVSFGAKTPKDAALRAVARALNVGEGNLSQVVAKMRIAGAMMPHGSVFSGPAASELTKICRAADLDWSIQDGALQFIERDKALQETAIEVSSDSGMIGSPTVDADGILTVKMLMIPGIRPGRLLSVNASRIKGGYRADKITWTGDSTSDEWTIEIEASRY